MKKRRKGNETHAEGRTSQPLKGRRFTPEQRQHAMILIDSGMERTRVAEVIGTSTESLRRWVAEAKRVSAIPERSRERGENGTRRDVAEASVARAAVLSPSPYAPKDPGQGLSEPEVAAILELKKRHPSMGAAQIRAQLKRFQGWRIAIKAIARTLRAHGYESVHRGSRPKGPEPIRFEAPRPNALWQIDYAEVRVGPERLHLLVVLDDFSRFVVGHGLCESPSAEAAIEVLKKAIARHGKPEAIRTDRGGGFLSAEFTRFLEAELIDHVVGRAYRPQGGGKVEALIGTVRRELWDVEHFADHDQATLRLAQFLGEYNHSRAHMGIDGVTPADRLCGRADRVLALVDAISRRRQGVPSGCGNGGAGTVEELTGIDGSSPLEVLRFVLVGDELELRFCGARFRLGRTKP